MVTVFYGNGPIMANILTSIVYILNSADYSTLLSLMLVLAGAFMIARWHSTTVRGGLGGHAIMMSLGTVILLYYGAWAPKTSLVVSDPLNNFQTAVNNVPEGFAIIVYTSNKITNGFADLFDQGFALAGFPSEMTYNNGMLPGIVSIESLGDLSPQDQFLTENISEYYAKCVFPAMLMDNGSGPTVDQIANSSNLLTTLQTNLSNAWVANYYSSASPQGTSMPCSPSGGTPNLYSNLVNDINTATAPGGSISQAYANRLLMGFAGAAQYANQASDQNLLQIAGNYITNGGFTSENLLAQAVLINSFNPALQQFASQNGMNPNALSSALTQNMLATTTSMNTSYVIARQLLPIAFLVISALIYAIMPIIFAMMFIPQLTRKFGIMGFELLMWIAFWQPLASVVNAIVQFLASSTFTTFGASAVAMNNWPYLMQHSYTLMAVAGDMMFSVPVLAFALASGSSYAMTSVAGSITGLGKGMAISAANTMATFGGAQTTAQQGSSETTLGKEASESKEQVTDPYFAQQMNDMQASNPAAMFAAFNKYGFLRMTQARENEIAKGLGTNSQLVNMDFANAIGSKQGQQTIGNIIGAYQAYENAVEDGYKGSFSQWTAEQSKYQNTNLVTQAQAMQELANKYFGGDLNKEMNYINQVKAMKDLGTAQGLNEALEAYEANGGKGGLVGMVAFNENLSTQALTASNKALQDDAKGQKESPYNFIYDSKTGQLLKEWAGSKAFIETARKLGINPIIIGMANNMIADIEKGVTMGNDAIAIGQMEAYQLLGELQGLGGNPSNAEFLAATNYAKQIAYANAIHGPAGATVIGRGQGEYDINYWERVGNLAGKLARFEAEGLISHYEAEKIIQQGRGDPTLIQSLLYNELNKRMQNLTPSLKNALMANDVNIISANQQDNRLLGTIISSKNFELSGLKQMAIETAADVMGKKFSTQVEQAVSSKGELGAKFSKFFNINGSMSENEQAKMVEQKFNPMYTKNLENYLHTHNITNGAQYVRAANIVAEQTKQQIYKDATGQVPGGTTARSVQSFVGKMTNAGRQDLYFETLGPGKYFMDSNNPNSAVVYDFKKAGATYPMGILDRDSLLVTSKQIETVANEDGFQNYNIHAPKSVIDLINNSEHLNSRYNSSSTINNYNQTHNHINVRPREPKNEKPPEENPKYADKKTATKELPENYGGSNT
ncbi:MAG: conjugal transfer protein TraG N-terminal domain-containing protein [Candidatus Micrarchaeaceae archaeon]